MFIVDLKIKLKKTNTIVFYFSVKLLIDKYKQTILQNIYNYKYRYYASLSLSLESINSVSLSASIQMTGGL